METRDPGSGDPCGPTNGNDAVTHKVSKLLDFLEKTVTDPRRIHTEATDGGVTDSRPITGFEKGSPGVVLCRVPGGDSKTAALRQKVAALELVVEEKHQSLIALKKLLEQQEEAKKQLKEQLQKGFKAELVKHEEAVERQLKMVDKLLAEKNELAKKCESLAEDMKQAEKRFQMKLEEQAKHLERETERQKRQSITAEKARREAWQREKTQEIKEMTIKGLEPEIQRLMDRHRDEKRRVEEKMRRTLEEFQKEAQERIQLTKEQMARDHDDDLERERAHHRRLMREQHEQFEKELREERDNHLVDTAEVEQRWENQKRQDASVFEERLSAAIEQEKDRAKENLERVQQEIDVIQRQHAAELRDLRQGAEAKEAEWRRNLADMVECETRKRLHVIKEELSAERDRKLEEVIEKMGREQLEIQQQHRQKIDEVARNARAEASVQLKEALERNAVLTESLELKRAEAEALGKRIVHLETISAERHDRILEYETKLEEGRRQSQAALEEKDTEARRLKLAIEDQQEMFAAELRSRDKTALDLSNQLKEAQQATEKLREGNEQQVEAIAAKVKQALWAKDETIRELREEMAALETKVGHFRDMLRKQREDLLAPCNFAIEDETTHITLANASSDGLESKQPPFPPEDAGKSAQASHTPSRRPRKTASARK